VSLIFLIAGTGLIIFTLDGKIQKITFYPNISPLQTLLIISIFFVLGLFLLNFFLLNIGFAALLISSIACWDCIGYLILCYFNQNKPTNSGKEIFN